MTGHTELREWATPAFWDSESSPDGRGTHLYCGSQPRLKTLFPLNNIQKSLFH